MENETYYIRIFLNKCFSPTRKEIIDMINIFIKNAIKN